MTMPLINEIAALIRRLDGGNTLTPYDLGLLLADHEPLREIVIDTDLARFVERTNGDKDTCPVMLAELIVAEFQPGEVAL